MTIPRLAQRDLGVTNLRAGADRSSVFRAIASVAYGLPPMYCTEHWTAQLQSRRAAEVTRTFAPTLEIDMSSKQTPAFRIYQVCPRGQDKGYWRELGVAFVNHDSSINLKFEAIPVDFNQTTVQLRPVGENRRSEETTPQS
jgi:hypothetical protein